MSTEGTLQAALFEALDAIRANYPEQAVSMCNELLTAYPYAVRVLRVRAQAYDGMQDWQHASEDYTRVLDTVPTDGNSIVSLAKSMHALGRTGEAQLIARQALDYIPNSEDALALAQNVEDGDPNALKSPVPGRVLLMRQQFDFGRIDKALESLRKFAAERPHRIDARVVLAELLWRSGARISAAELCQAILDELPDCLPAHALLVLIWQKVGALRISESHLRTLDQLDPDHRETREWLGELSPVTTIHVPAKPDSVVSRFETDDDRNASSAANQAEHEDYLNDLIANAGPIAPDSLDNNDDFDNDTGEVLANVAPLTWERDALIDDENPAKPWWLNKLESAGPPTPEGVYPAKPQPSQAITSAKGEIEADTKADNKADEESELESETLSRTEMAMPPTSPSSLNESVESLDNPTESLARVAPAMPKTATNSLPTELSVTEEITIIAPMGARVLVGQAANAMVVPPPAPPLPQPEQRIWRQSER